MNRRSHRFHNCHSLGSRAVRGQMYGIRRSKCRYLLSASRAHLPFSLRTAGQRVRGQKKQGFCFSQWFPVESIRGGPQSEHKVRTRCNCSSLIAGRSSQREQDGPTVGVNSIEGVRQRLQRQQKIDRILVNDTVFNPFSALQLPS